MTYIADKRATPAAPSAKFHRSDFDGRTANDVLLQETLSFSDATGLDDLYAGYSPEQTYISENPLSIQGADWIDPYSVNVPGRFAYRPEGKTGSLVAQGFGFELPPDASVDGIFIDITVLDSVGMESESIDIVRCGYKSLNDPDYVSSLSEIHAEYLLDSTLAIYRYGDAGRVVSVIVKSPYANYAVHWFPGDAYNKIGGLKVFETGSEVGTITLTSPVNAYVRPGDESITIP